MPSNPDESSSNKDEKKKEDRKDKVKTAKKIAKDMEKWAKTLNQRKEASKVSQLPAAVAAPIAGASRGLEDLAFSMFTKHSATAAVAAAAAKTGQPSPAATALRAEGGPPPASGLTSLANYGSDSENEDQVRMAWNYSLPWWIFLTEDLNNGHGCDLRCPLFRLALVIIIFSQHRPLS